MSLGDSSRSRMLEGVMVTRQPGSQAFLLMFNTQAYNELGRLDRVRNRRQLSMQKRALSREMDTPGMIHTYLPFRFGFSG